MTHRNSGKPPAGSYPAQGHPQVPNRLPVYTISVRERMRERERERERERA
jgi:hypothetical protein